MPKYTVRWKKKTRAGRGEEQFYFLGTLKKPKAKTARKFAQTKRKDGYTRVTIYDSYSGKSKKVE